ncbi:ABC transporter, partial [Streptomyces sp. NPDC001770]
DRLDTAHVEADELTVHTPDLDDVFFALTGGARVPHQSGPSAASEQSVNSQEDEVR